MATPQIVGTQVIGPRADGTPGINAQGIGFRGTIPYFNSVRILNENVYNYNFSNAPADWWVQSGHWGMVNSGRSVGWLEFNGRSAEVAALWNKRRFSGDFSYQVYFSFKANTIGSSSWREKHSDMALNFCGDGRNLSSGYSLIIGADDNRHTLLLRKGEQVAKSLAPEALFPSLADGRPRPVPAPTLQNIPAPVSEVPASPLQGFSIQNRAVQLWYARIEKTGNRIECWLDNNLIFTYDDPQPIDSGQFALWTFNNSITVPSVQIYYENEIKPASRFKSDKDSNMEEGLNAIKDEIPKDAQGALTGQ